ncbi:MAG: 16S rRNA (adenine(1518)-N(6)/adenine(1519)-N(6))-dimethyltransferase RsmA [Patescibacteria group bacterium]
MIKIQDILNRYNIKPNKFMGQNFLIDENVLNKIIETANIKPNDIILEVGPGLGNLTLELAKRAERVIAIEKDRELCEILEKILKDNNIKNVQIINDDILKMGDIARPHVGRAMSYMVVANIPYYLTSPLIRMFLETENKPSEIILMIQKEVAQRICASPPTKSPKAIGPELRSSSRAKMSLLAVSVQFYAKPEIISFVSKNSFYPVPKVDSSIIKIVPYNTKNVGRPTSNIDTEKFFKLVKMGFSAKRKMLKNNIPEINFEKLNLNPGIRAESLTINDWIKIYEQFNP